MEWNPLDFNGFWSFGSCSLTFKSKSTGWIVPWSSRHLIRHWKYCQLVQGTLKTNVNSMHSFVSLLSLTYHGMALLGLWWILIHWIPFLDLQVQVHWMDRSMELKTSNQALKILSSWCIALDIWSLTYHGLESSGLGWILILWIPFFDLQVQVHWLDRSVELKTSNQALKILSTWCICIVLDIWSLTYHGMESSGLGWILIRWILLRSIKQYPIDWLCTDESRSSTFKLQKKILKINVKSASTLTHSYLGNSWISTNLRCFFEPIV